MTMHRRPIPGRSVRVIVALCLLAAQWPVTATAADTTPDDDLKRIEYRTYFRGRYAEAIEALTMFLARTDLEPRHVRTAREFLAASFVLSGRPDEARALYRTMLTEDPSWTGPSPEVFRPEVIAVFASVRRGAPSLREGAAAATLVAGEGAASPEAATKGRPIWKRWWFYAGLVGVLVVAGAAGGGSDTGSNRSSATGTVDVGVTVR